MRWVLLSVGRAWRGSAPPHSRPTAPPPQCSTETTSVCSYKYEVQVKKQCFSVSDVICTAVPEQQCQTVNKPVCNTVKEKKCTNSYRKTCQTVQEKVCSGYTKNNQPDCKYMGRQKYYLLA